MSTRKYTNEQFIEAVASSTSIAQVLMKLSLKPCGGNYASFKNLVTILNLDTSHFKGKAWNKGNIGFNKVPILDYLSNTRSIQSYKLKMRLLKESYFSYRCMNCNLTEWYSLPIPLELHHLDGNPNNNSFSNLTLLCPNCHALTSNYRGKNKSS